MNIYHRFFFYLQKDVRHILYQFNFLDGASLSVRRRFHIIFYILCDVYKYMFAIMFNTAKCFWGEFHFYGSQWWRWWGQCHCRFALRFPTRNDNLIKSVRPKLTWNVWSLPIYLIIPTLGKANVEASLDYAISLPKDYIFIADMRIMSFSMRSLPIVSHCME